MKIRNITGGILQDTKTGWILQPDQVIEVDGTKPEIQLRVQQLSNHGLIEVLESEGVEVITVEVKPVEVEESKEEAPKSQEESVPEEQDKSKTSDSTAAEPTSRRGKKR